MEAKDKASREDQHVEFMTEIEKLQGVKKDATNIFAVVITNDEAEEGHYLGASIGISKKDLIQALTSVMETDPRLVKPFEQAIAMYKLKSNPLAALLDMLKD